MIIIIYIKKINISFYYNRSIILHPIQDSDFESAIKVLTDLPLLESLYVRSYFIFYI